MCNYQLLISSVATSRAAPNVAPPLLTASVVIMNLLIQAWPQVAGPHKNVLRPFDFAAKLRVCLRKTTDTGVGWTDASKLVF